MSHAPARQTFFLPVGDGQRLCVFHPAATTARGRVLYIAPFAEEMNKARRMAALQARALAEAGFAVLQMDLLGCGDSSGDFGDASWSAWLDDLALAHAWLAAHAAGPSWLWGLRAGCLLAGELGRRLEEPCDYLFWQPSSAGKTVLQQFLRLKLAGSILDNKLDSGPKGGMERLRQTLADGQPVEVAGYRLAPALAAGLEASQLAPPPRPARLEWLELSTRDDATLTPLATKTLAQWQAQGHLARGQVVPGPAFWQTTEIEDAPALLRASVAALCEPAEVPA